MTTDRIRLTTWVRPWTAEITRRGAREEGMTLSAYVALVLEGNCDPDVDPEHPEYLHAPRPQATQGRAQRRADCGGRATARRRRAEPARRADPRMARSGDLRGIPSGAWEARMPLERFVATHLQDCVRANGLKTAPCCSITPVDYAVRLRGMTLSGAIPPQKSAHMAIRTARFSIAVSRR